jgi:hypothetical protein
VAYDENWPPHFEPEMITRSGRWFVAVKTGHGPDSHIGDFETEAEAVEWISTKSKYWPGRRDAFFQIKK